MRDSNGKLHPIMSNMLFAITGNHTHKEEERNGNNLSVVGLSPGGAMHAHLHNTRGQGAARYHQKQTQQKIIKNCTMHHCKARALIQLINEGTAVSGVSSAPLEPLELLPFEGDPILARRNSSSNTTTILREKSIMEGHISDERLGGSMYETTDLNIEQIRLNFCARVRKENAPVPWPFCREVLGTTELLGMGRKGLRRGTKEQKKAKAKKAKAKFNKALEGYSGSRRTKEQKKATAKKAKAKT